MLANPISFPFTVGVSCTSFISVSSNDPGMLSWEWAEKWDRERVLKAGPAFLAVNGVG